MSEANLHIKSEIRPFLLDFLNNHFIFLLTHVFNRLVILFLIVNVAI